MLTMNKILRYTLPALALWGMITLNSCTKDFEEINTNQLQPGIDVLDRDNIIGSAYLPNLEFMVVWTAMSSTAAANNYQVIENLTEESWMGYHAPRDAKWPSKNLSQFYFDVGWNNMGFNENLKAMNPWQQTKKLTMEGESKNEEVFSIAQISKIFVIQKLTDMFGPIPYSQVGSGSFKVAYDSQEQVYRSFFEELTRAVDVLYSASGRTLMVKDYVYEGNADQWAKLGNSLMLRLAMRIRYVAPDLSQKYAEQAASHPAGVIESVADQAQIDKESGIQPINSLYIVAEAYDDTRMGGTIQCYMKGYNDPRLSKYFTGDLDMAVPPAIPSTGNQYNGAAKPLIKQFDPSVWMTAAEVAFLRAEAALAGYNVGGTARQYYEQGVRLSFEQWGIDGTEADVYLMSKQRPAAYVDRVNPNYSQEAPSTITPAWDDAADKETNLERIITQKYLAIYPNGPEAWSEWRRTGYPHLLRPLGNISNFGVVTSDGKQNGVRRWPYPQDEMTQNTENVQHAINTWLGGSNMANVNVWWDVKTKN